MKTIKYFILLLVFCSFIVLAGCNIFQPTTSYLGGREYFPNTDGYSWTYVLRAEIPPFGIITGETTSTFSGTKTIFGKPVQVMINQLGTTYISSQETYYDVSDSYVKIYGWSFSPTSEATTHLVFPLSLGQTWNTSTVQSVEWVTVPKGTFECVKIRSTYDDGYSDTWYAKNVGWIKSCSIDNTLNSISTEELKSTNF